VARVARRQGCGKLGRPVLVENVGGAGGNIACNRIAHSPPDGYALVMCGNGSLVIAPSLYTKLAYDPVKDFVPITQVFVAANILVVHPDVPVNSIPELLRSPRPSPASSPTRIRASAPRSISPASCSSTWRMSTSGRSRIAAPRPCLPDLLQGG